MYSANVIFSITNMLSAIVLIIIILYAYKHRETNGATQYVYLVVAMVIHATGYAAELVSQTPEAIMLCTKIEYIGISFYPVLLMGFSRSYGDDRSIITNIVAKALLIINSITVILVVTYPASNLYYANIDFHYIDGFQAMAITRGTWYFIHTGAIGVAIGYSIYIYLKKASNSKGIYRKRAVLMLAGIMIPIIGAIIYVTGLSILDLSSISYMIMGIFVLFGLFKFDMLSLVPVSYQKVFESIDEAVFVIDQNLDIINSNEAANRMFNKAGGIKVGEPIATLCEIYGVCYDCTKKEQVITNKLTEQILNLKITRIYNKRKDIVGYICVFMDVTEAHIAKQKLEKLVITDDLTGISNRRHLLEQYASDIKSKSKDLYMAFIDVDFFKKVNDTYGHQIGDEVLVELAELIKGYFELPSYVGRFGGEEFIAAMHSEDEQSAFAYLDYFRIMVSNHKFAYDIPSITISIGFVESTGNIDEDIRLADKALYYAKENGRNKVISYHDQTIISA